MEDTTAITLLRKLNLILMLFLGGCTASPTWHLTHQKGSQKHFDSARLSYPIRDKVNEVAVEMIYAKNRLKTYLEVHSQHIPPYQGNAKEAEVVLTTQNNTFHGIAHRHEGGQRLSLPADLQQSLVDALLKGVPVTIKLVGYSTTLQPQDFKKFYSELKKAPFKIPAIRTL